MAGSERQAKTKAEVSDTRVDYVQAKTVQERDDDYPRPWIELWKQNNRMIEWYGLH